MKKRFRFITIILAALLIVGVFAGCSKKNGYDKSSFKRSYTLGLLCPAVCGYKQGLFQRGRY
ncbi:MAG: hypothetical protein ACOX1Q_00560 [Eubacteriales bacterium]